MRQKTLFTLCFIALFSGAFAQKAKPMQKRNNSFPSNKKGQLFGIHFSLNDFTTPETFKTSPTPIAKSERKFAELRDMSAGVSVSYWKGLTTKIDFCGKVNGVFYDYASIKYGTTGKTEIGLELEPTINIRPFNDDNRWAPFLTVGVGAGMYTSHIGAYVPVGGGLQINWSGNSYLFVQGQYHFTLTKKVLGDNLAWSIGFAESF